MFIRQFTIFIRQLMSYILRLPSNPRHQGKNVKILFIGSIPGHKPESGQTPLPEHEALFAAARDLGKEAARTNNIVLIGSDSKNTIDYYIAQGVIDYCKENATEQRHIEIHRPNDSKSPYSEDIPKNLLIDRQFYHQDSSHQHKWISNRSKVI